MDNYKRGEIFYIMRDSMQTGSEIYHGRPAIIVSNDFLNATSNVVEVVFLTTQPKKDIGTHVRITSTGRTSIALCEQITTIATEKIGNYMATATEAEMQEIDNAIAKSLSLCDNPPPRESGTVIHEVADIARERDWYKSLYENLLNRVITR